MNFFNFRKPIGRFYGLDAATVILLVVWRLLDIIIPAKGLWRPVGIVVVNGVLLFMLIRIFSTDFQSRSKENQQICSLVQKAADRIRQLVSRVSAPSFAQKDPGYKTFSCPNCKQKMRAPKGRGKIRVTCHSCGHIFEKKV